MQIGISIDYRGANDLLREKFPKMVPYVQARALTALAVKIKERVQTEMPRVFDRPTDFTVRGVFVQVATAKVPIASVFFPDSPDETGKGKREYIRPGVQGASQRKQKRVEALLTRAGHLPAGWVTVIGKNEQRDGHGNLAGATYRQIINVLQVKPGGKVVSGRATRAAKKLGVSSLFFIVPVGKNTLGKNGNSLPPGVWRNLGEGNIRQTLGFVRKASYKKRLDIQAIAESVTSSDAAQAWNEALQTQASQWFKPKVK